MRNGVSIFATLLLLLTLGSSNPVAAQEPAWRHDYAAARKEATETGRPILMDFGTENCIWCRKQDATTFRDPKVVKLLNEQLIPLKIDASRQPKLAQALGITSYPTLVLASPDGKVLGRRDEFVDVGQLLALLGKAPAPGQKAAAPQPAPQVPVQPTAAAGMLARAKGDFEVGHYAETLRACDAIISTQPTSPEAREARRLTERIASDPNARRVLKEQIEAELNKLQPKIAIGLER